MRVLIFFFFLEFGFRYSTFFPGGVFFCLVGDLEPGEGKVGLG